MYKSEYQSRNELGFVLFMISMFGGSSDALSPGQFKKSKKHRRGDIGDPRDICDIITLVMVGQTQT